MLRHLEFLRRQSQRGDSRFLTPAQFAAGMAIALIILTDSPTFGVEQALAGSTMEASVGAEADERRLRSDDGRIVITRKRVPSGSRSDLKSSDLQARGASRRENHWLIDHRLAPLAGIETASRPVHGPERNHSCDGPAVPRPAVIVRPFSRAYRPVDAVVLGARPDPLAAYRDLLPPEAGPVAPREAAVLLGAARAARVQQIIAPTLFQFDSPALPPDVPLPAAEVPGRAAAPIGQLRVEAIPLRTGGTADVTAIAVRVPFAASAGPMRFPGGTARFRLVARAQRTIPVTDGYVTKQLGRPKQLATWTRSFERGNADFIALRLTSPVPAHNPNVTAEATLFVQLTVPGEGVFEAEPISLLLRDESGLRESLRVRTGSPYLHDERLTGRRNTSGLRRLPLTSARPNGGFFSVEP
ncbi:hypothetical protein [Stratiformator vulcanicus]|uniref:Uncharacterized protein n=1 Tax=Stratiformator vulcanicus TaxID=2527980 RepID=A0A517QY00_9PLAN|nr:hypothetical protein [Stratiformator vulcanicus]QDT36536.1 hypothetical protein Pan189_08950 [Stratiformator vulcanicus]